MPLAIHSLGLHSCILCRHDFVVVEVIEFYDDEDEELPPPLTLKDVITMNKVREGEGGTFLVGGLVISSMSLRRSCPHR